MQVLFLVDLAFCMFNNSDSKASSIVVALEERLISSGCSRGASSKDLAW